MYFFNDVISTYTISIGSLFNNFKVQRINKKVKPSQIKEIDVPLEYSSKTHWYLKTNKNVSDKYNINKILPRMSFSLESLELDDKRQTNKFNTLKFDGDMSAGVRKWCQTCVPYTFHYKLDIYTRYQSELNQIIEQILPFFPANSRDLHIKEVPILNIYRSSRVQLDGISQSINVDYQDNGDRVINMSLDFSLDGYIYPPITEDSIIKEIDVKLYLDLLEVKYVKEEDIVITETETENG